MITPGALELRNAMLVDGWEWKDAVIDHAEVGPSMSKRSFKWYLTNNFTVIDLVRAIEHEVMNRKGSL